MSQLRENLQTNYGVDGWMEAWTLFHRALLVMTQGPTRETTKEVSDQTLPDNFKHCKSSLLEICMMQGGQDVADVRGFQCQILAS